MEEKTKMRIKDLFFGIGLSLIFFSLLFSLSAILFSEMQKPSLALNLTIVLSFVSAAIYWFLECSVFYKDRSSAFSVGYFGTIVIGAAITFFVSNIIPIYYVFDADPLITALYIRTACVRFCLFNAVALVIRLGIETFRYLKTVFGYQNEQ